MLGDVGGDDQMTEEVVGKRARTVQNYSEEQYDGKFEAECTFSDEEPGSEDDNDVDGDDSFHQGGESECDSEDYLVETLENELLHAHVAGVPVAREREQKPVSEA
jgi:hypothetical protein